MKIENIKKTIAYIFLDWGDIEMLKAGQTICDRYNGEHKFNLAVIPETLLIENWTETSSVRPRIRFDDFLHDFFLDLSVFDVRFAFMPSLAIRFKLKNSKRYRKIRIFFPTYGSSL